jgi:hypothetical protein
MCNNIMVLLHVVPAFIRHDCYYTPVFLLPATYTIEPNELIPRTGVSK